MTKFKVDDIVIGNDSNKYLITKKGVKHIVRNTSRDAIEVEILEGDSIGYKTWVSDKFFSLYIKPAPVTESRQRYKLDYSTDLNTTFITVGDVTIAVPLEVREIGVTARNPEDAYSEEIAKSVAFFRMLGGSEGVNGII